MRPAPTSYKSSRSRRRDRQHARRVRSPDMISTHNITKSFGREAILRGISMQAEPKQITLMVGPNGAGKSTTVKVLAGLIRPNSGTALINGFDVVQQRIAAQRSAAYLPQRPSFHPKLTCLEILRFYA